MTRDEEMELAFLVQYDYLLRLAGKASKCMGKHKYDSFTQANQTLHHSRLKKIAGAYHCQHCGFWHVGGNTGKREHRLIQQRRKPK